MCKCGCQEKPEKKETDETAKVGYICYQCNTFKDAPAGQTVPECCGKKMEEMD